jgi:hypothetical protein
VALPTLRVLYLSSEALRLLPPDAEARLLRRLRHLFVYDKWVCPTDRGWPELAAAAAWPCCA